MVRRLVLAIAALSASLVSAPAFSAAPAAQRIVAVGDLHGDYDAWRTIAKAAGIEDARGHWAGGKTILVQMGDVTDRWADSLKIIRDLQQLQKDAPRAGAVVAVLTRGFQRTFASELPASIGAAVLVAALAWLWFRTLRRSWT